MKKKKKATKWIIFARVLLVLQLIASAMIFAMAVKTKMLPAKYIMFAAGGLLIMEFLVFALVHLGQNIMKPKASGYFKRGLGTFLFPVISLSVPITLLSTDVPYKLHMITSIDINVPNPRLK